MSVQCPSCGEMIEVEVDFEETTVRCQCGAVEVHAKVAIEFVLIEERDANAS